jgi:hypothetical protein
MLAMLKRWIASEMSRTLPPFVAKEQRKFGRRAVFKAAVLLLDSGDRIDCTLLDISDGGAKVRIANQEFFPAELILEVPGDDLMVRCHVVYTEERVMGLQFIKPPRRISWTKK